MASSIYPKISALVVEDDDYTRSLICRLLFQIGLRSVGQSSNGKDGLMELVRTRPDIVFCDIHMEPMNGKLFLQGVRNIRVKGVNETPIVFITGDSQVDTVLFAKEHGVDGYLVKPISLAQLKERLDVIVAPRADVQSRARIL